MSHPVLKTFIQRKFMEPVIIFSIAGLVWLFAGELDLFERFIEFAEQHEEYELDEVFVALFCMGLAGFVYAWRRSAQQHRELKKRLNAESNLDWLSKHDNLTSLPNRHFLAEFNKRVDSSDSDHRYGVISLDLNGFKKANDLLGHACGDKVLREVAGRILDVPDVKMAFRLGGDEFLALTDLSEGADPVLVGQQIQKCILGPISVEGTVSHVGVSVGVSQFPADAERMEDVIHCADLAMYAAKREGGNSLCEFEKSMFTANQERTRLEQDLLVALNNGEIRPHYQPLKDIKSGELIGFEALARWNRKGYGSVSPETFIQVAEDMGLITELSDQMLRQACRDAQEWPSHMLLSFNLSPLQMSDGLIGLRILKVLEETNFLPTRLEVEITESALIQDVDAAARVLQDLRAAGIQIALDDFGTGYSSLSQLSNLAFDRIKIDRSFIRNFNEDDKDFKIVKTIISLGQGLGIHTTAEGIEGEEQLAVLKSLGCECGQGYFLGRPMDADKAQSIAKLGKAPEADKVA